MMLPVPSVLTSEEVAVAHKLLQKAAWKDGRSTAGKQAAQVKNNTQLPHECEAATSLRAMVLQALDRQPVFFSAALPKRVYTPTFNRYAGDANHYGKHVDNAMRFAPDTGQRVRTDLSCTLFLSAPEDYDGGELIIHETHGDQRVKLSAGSLVLYPGNLVHQVARVTRGERLACFFWVESMVRSTEQRQLLFEMDQALTQLRQTEGESDVTVALTGTYHNLLRMWADA